MLNAERSAGLARKRLTAAPVRRIAKVPDVVILETTSLRSFLSATSTPEANFFSQLHIYSIRMPE
jgi:hypothetical protein